MTTDGKIWLLLDSSKFGGIETHVLQLARSLAKHKMAVEVVFLSDYGPHPIMPLLQQHNIGFSVLKFGLLSLIKAFKQQQPLLVHTHGYKAGIYARLAGLFSTTTLVSTFHAGEVLSGKLALYDFADRISACLSHALIAVSCQINARLKHKCTVVDNFVAIEQQAFPGEQIAFVGRLSHEKGPDLFLKLSSCFTQRLFNVYGDGPMRNELEQQAGNNVIFHGHQSNMDQQWQHIGLLVMPSRQEGLPLAALEAMAHGIPVCAFNVGSLNRLIDADNGWLAPAGDLPRLRHAISQWLSSSLKCKFARSRSARKRVIVNFSDIAAMPTIISCYNKALRNNNTSNTLLLSANKEQSHGVE